MDQNNVSMIWIDNQFSVEVSINQNPNHRNPIISLWFLKQMTQVRSESLKCLNANLPSFEGTARE